MNIADTLSPKSDQMDYEDFLSGPKTFTVTEVRKGPSAEQPVEILVKEFDRPWRPAKTVRRILVACWGPDASAYVGRTMTLYGDPTVRFGGAAVGGIRLSHVSHIDAPVTVTAMITRGKRAPFTVNPLTTPAPNERVTKAAEALKGSTTLDGLNKVWERITAGGLDKTDPLPDIYFERTQELT